MELFILRHGIALERAGWNSRDDSARPLTREGKKQLRKNSAALKTLGLDFDLILSSPFARAKKTAEIVAKKLGLQRRLKFSTFLEPEGSSSQLIHELNRLKPAPKTILLVGHEPYLSELISKLVSGRTEARLDFKKGGLCKLEVEKLRDGKCAKLAWLLTPAQLKLLR